MTTQQLQELHTTIGTLLLARARSDKGFPSTAGNRSIFPQSTETQSALIYVDPPGVTPRKAGLVLGMNTPNGLNVELSAPVEVTAEHGVRLLAGFGQVIEWEAPYVPPADIIRNEYNAAVAALRTAWRAYDFSTVGVLMSVVFPAILKKAVDQGLDTSFYQPHAVIAELSGIAVRLDAGLK